ncbi:MAG: hypothetical protein CMA58_02135 [Euryarchaeota archaeon]|nr:hypothetical protein [Euryarchaeota archaeon]|tara:strand:+ start:1864 stop:2796 length:933 start_codon:yes stop_codon:yes gene_type:complete
MLNLLYKSRLVELREIAEREEIQKSGSVEVLRARIIKQKILSGIDLSWEGIQGTPHKELGEILRIFGIKSSGSHKERRRRLWLHLNFDSRRMTIERLAEMDKDTLYELCRRLEMPLSGTRTILMGRVAGVLTNQSKGWGRIKRSLHRNGIEIIDLGVEKEELVGDIVENVNSEVFQEEIPKAYLEDARELMIIDIDKESSVIQGNLLAIQARIPELERMVSTILREYGGEWSSLEKNLLIRLVERRGWPIMEDKVKERLLMVATDIAENKGGIIKKISDEKKILQYEVKPLIDRIRLKMKQSDEVLKEDM